MFIFFNSLAQADLSDFSRIFHSKPTPKAFEICYGGGCFQVAQTDLTVLEWQKIEQIFQPISQNAEQERARIAQAIGEFEKIVGAKTGTAGDRAGTFNNSEFPNQLDCNDESINSTTYMRLLAQAGLLKFHQIEDTRTRNFFFTGWPHSTAMISELATGAQFAVDSWFYDNGQPAVIVPFAQWKDNFYPEDSPVSQAHQHAKH